MLRPAAAAALAVIAGLGAAAAQDGARDEARWGPVAEQLGTGSGICRDGENIVCAVVLCEEGALTLGVLAAGHGTGAGGERPAFRGAIEVDGETVERDMQSRVVMVDFLHVRTPVDPGEQLWQRLRAGNRLAMPAASEGEPLDYTLRGSAAELDRVAAACR